MAGSHLGWRWLLQPVPDQTYIRYPSAVSLLLLGLAMASLGRRRRTAVLAALAAVPPLAVLLGEPGVIGTFLRAFAPGGWTASGMALNTAVALFVACLAVELLVVNTRFSRAVSAVAATLMVVIGATAVLGFATGLEAAYDWRLISPMAPTTSVAVLLIAVGLLAWIVATDREQATYAAWLPWAFGLSATFGALILWRALAVAQTLDAAYGPVLALNLVAGLMVAVLLAVAVWLSQLSSRHALEARRAEEAMREMALRLQLAVAASGTGLWNWDLKSNEVYFSPEWKQQLGYADHELANRYEEAESRLHPDDRGRALETTRRTIDQRISDYSSEFRMRHRDGTYRSILSRGRLLFAADGTPIRLTGCHVDLTDVRKATDALVAANATLEEQAIRLRRKNEENEAFVYSVSHDLRAPLVNMQGFARELALSCDELKRMLGPGGAVFDAARMRTVLEEDIPGALVYITASTTRFERLINGLLALSRSGRQEFRRQALDMNAIAHDVVNSLRSQAVEKGAEIDVGDLPAAIGDADAVPQVLANLVGNSLKYLDPKRGGRIVVAGERTNGRSHYWVRDNGVGIPPGVEGRLFQAFQRFHPTMAEGDGMGLAIVKRVVERLNGAIWTDAAPGGGTVMHFTLPAAESRQADG